MVRICKSSKPAVDDLELDETELAIRDYNKPMGVATFRLGEDAPEKYNNILPNLSIYETLKIMFRLFADGSPQHRMKRGKFHK